MSTMLYKDNCVAAGSIIMDGRYHNPRIDGNRIVLTWIGELEDGFNVFYWLREGRKPTTLPKVDPSSLFWVFRKGLPPREMTGLLKLHPLLLLDGVAGAGIGAQQGLEALRSGASLEEAIRIAASFGAFSGGYPDIIDLDKVDALHR